MIFSSNLTGGIANKSAILAPAKIASAPQENREMLDMGLVVEVPE